MAQFYGTLQGQRGEVTRTGGKQSGIRIVAASWEGAIEVNVREMNGKEIYLVEAIPWQGKGKRFEIARGVIGKTCEYPKQHDLTNK